MDILNRQPFIDDIKTIVKLYSEKKRNVTFAINGKWGSGKTFILKMLEEQLKNDYIVFHYNAWEYDYYDEPLIALITSTINSLGDYIEVDKTTKQIGKGIFENAKSVLVKILGEICKNKLGVDIPKVIKDVHDDVKKQKVSDKSYDSYLDITKKIKEVKDALRELSKIKTVVFVVDEMDRCLPEYAIRVLERLHHVFSEIENLQVILAVDKEQLDTTVKTIFGNTTETNGYLKKFITFAVELDVGETDEDFVNNAFTEYAALFKPWWNMTKQEDANSFIKLLLAPYDMRTRLGILEKAMCLHSMLYKNDPPAELTYMCIELLMIVCQKEDLLNNDKISKINNPLNTFLSSDHRFAFFDEKIREKNNVSTIYKRYDKSTDYHNRTNYQINLIDVWSTMWVIVCWMYGDSIATHIMLNQGYGKTDYRYMYALRDYAKDYFQFCNIVL